jgi:flagellin
MSGFAISSRARSNLPHLQQASDLITQTKTPISTGKGGNAQLDKRVNFFTVEGLSANDLNTLADAMAADINFIQAAHNCIAAITKLAQSAQVLVSHARRIDDATVRAKLAGQFDALLGQIDRLARDAGCKGVNLPGGNDLPITINKDGSSRLVVNSFNDTADGDLPINTSQNNWATSPDIQGAADNLKVALVTLQSQAQSLSSSLSAVQIRQDFTKAMINALQTGAENLTPIDNREEGANLLALQARQQSSTIALSLAAQAEQNVLRLLW